MTVPWNCRNVPTTHVEALPLTADGKCKAIPEISDIPKICTNNQWVNMNISTIQNYCRLKPRPFQISAKYNSWIAENFNLLHLFQPILTDLLYICYIQIPGLGLKGPRFSEKDCYYLQAQTDMPFHYLKLFV